MGKSLGVLDILGAQKWLTIHEATCLCMDVAPENFDPTNKPPGWDNCSGIMFEAFDEICHKTLMTFQLYTPDLEETKVDSTVLKVWLDIHKIYPDLFFPDAPALNLPVRTKLGVKIESIYKALTPKYKAPTPEISTITSQGSTKTEGGCQKHFLKVEDLFTNPPVRHSEVYECFKNAVENFILKNKKLPSREELFDYLKMKFGWDAKNKNILGIGSVGMCRDNFIKNFSRYTKKPDS